jgi:glycosyltransferase involved in cell wall biosynthesis
VLWGFHSSACCPSFMKKPKILFLWTEWSSNEYRKKNNAYGGIGYYRIIKPAQYLRQWYDIDVKGKDISDLGATGEQVWKHVFETYDLVFTKHTDNPSAANAILALAEYYKKPVIVDMDDNYLTIREDNPAYQFYSVTQKERYILSAFLNLATGLTVSTQPLKEAYQSINKNIDVLPNCNDIKDWNYLPKKHFDGHIRIGYAGSVTHNSDFQLIVPAIKTVLKKYPHVEMEILGAMHKDVLRGFQKQMRSVRGKLTMHYGSPAWDGYGTRLAEMGWDIGIAPLIDDEFNRGKSHIKWFEYSMFKLPTIASKVYPYFQPVQDTNTIVDGQTGFLCSTTDEWVQRLSQLIENEQLRHQLADNAYQYIKDNWQWQQHAAKWKAVIDKYL